MKKALLIIIATLVLFGCSKKKIDLEQKYYGTGQIIQIENSDLKKLEETEESFLVFAYMSGCSACSLFDHYLLDFAEKYNISIYQISANEITGTHLEEIKYFPTVAIYEKGKIIKYLDAQDDDDLKHYQSTENFYKWVSEYVNVKK